MIDRKTTGSHSQCSMEAGYIRGLKAYRTADDRILMFRPEENALRMLEGSERMSMPAPDADMFVNAVKQTVLANKRWVSSRQIFIFSSLLNLLYVIGKY